MFTKCHGLFYTVIVSHIHKYSTAKADIKFYFTVTSELYLTCVYTMKIFSLVMLMIVKFSF